MDKILIQLTNQRAVGLLYELEELHLIKVLKKEVIDKLKLSDKYKGVITQKKGRELNEHIKQMRNEWNNI